MTETKKLLSQQQANRDSDSLNSSAHTFLSHHTKVALFLLTSTILVIAIALGLFIQNQSLKAEMGLPTFKLPWTQATCTYNGQEYQIGESVPSVDGCNSCSCDESGQIACTEMACETSKSFQKEVNEITWKEYKGEDFNYQYPSSLVSIRNPRAYESQRDIQYFLLNKQIASDYMDCLQTAKKQWEAYRLDGVEPDWVDWEGACDINRVILQISVGKKSLEDITDNSNQSNENSQPYSIKSNQGNLWIVNPSGGMGDTIAIEAHTQHNGHIQSIVISSHLRGMSKFIDPNDNYAASEYDFDNKHLEAFKSIAHHILSTFEFNDQTQATTDDDASELPSEIIKYAPKSDWQTYTDDLANFEIQFESSSKVSDNPGATVKGESLSITSCQFNDPQGKEVCLTDYSIRVFNNYTGGSRRTWFQANINSYKPYYVNWIIDGKKALVAIDGNPGGSSSLNILIPYDNQIIVFWVSGVAWDPDTGELPDLSYFKSILSTFKTLK